MIEEMTKRSYSSWAVPGLRAARWSKMLTIRDLAKASAVSTTTITRLEGGEHAQVGTIRKLADALGVDVDTLLEEPGPEADE